ncbi:DUF397 domain-containing protein [Amycolatopsis sp. NPDC003865]
MPTKAPCRGTGPCTWSATTSENSKKETPVTVESLSSSASRRDGWFKSSYSNAGGSCVEARLTSDVALVRDTKDQRPDQPFIEFSATAWTSFLNLVAPEGI